MKYFCLLLLNFLTITIGNDIALQELSTANNLFSISLFKIVYQSSSKNFVLSPLSAEIALSLIQSGCRGKTADEIRTALYLSNNNEEMKQGFKTLLTSLRGNGFYTLHVVNKIYGRKNIIFKVNFKKVAKQIYRAETENIDFTSKVKAARNMNKWVERNTKNKIHNLVLPNAIGGNNALLVLNAFYFKANWSTPFPRANTRKSSFYKNSYQSIFVDTMFQTDPDSYKYHENFELDAKFVELPFRGNEASMVIILPNSKDGLVRLENQIEKVLEPPPFIMEQLTIGLPKFQIATRLHLKNVLKAMGVSKPFDKKQADLSGIAGKRGSLFIHDVLEKVYIHVEEGGVDVAASTEIDVFKGFAPTPFLPSKEFIVDHPFIYYIKINNFIACVGRVLDPIE